MRSLRRKDSVIVGSTGRPGLACNACCLAAKETGGGGGAVLATTARSIIRDGGAAILPGAPAVPNTLARCGASGAAVPTTCACATALAGTATAAVCTDRARSEERRVGKEGRCRWSPDQ